MTMRLAICLIILFQYSELLLAQQPDAIRGIPVEPTAPPESTPPPRAIPVQPATPVQPTAPVIPEPAPDGRLTTPQGDRNSIRVQPETGTLRASPDRVQFKVASNLYRDKLYELAAVEFERYLNRFPEGQFRDAAFFRLAECYRELGAELRSRELYRRIISVYGTGNFVGSAAYRLAEMLVRSNDLEAARSYFELAAANLEDPKLKLAATFRQARSLEMLGRPESARLAYRKLLQQEAENPYREATLQALAQIAKDTGRQKEAIGYYSSLAEDAIKPELRAESALAGALLASDLRDYQRATELFQKAIQIPIDGPWQKLARIGLLRVDYERGDFQKVVDTYTNVAQQNISTMEPEALILVGNSYRQLGQLKEASDIYEKIIADFPASKFASDASYQQLVSLYAIDDPRLLPSIDRFLANYSSGKNAAQVKLLKAEALYKQGELKQAGELFAELTAASLPNKFLPNVFYKAGWCLSQAGDFTPAIEYYSEFIERFGGNELLPAVLAERGLAYQKTTNLSSALDDFERVADEFPDSKQAEVALQQSALIRGQLKDNKGMVKAFQKLLSKFPQSAAAAQANYWIGWALFEEKNYQQAIPALQKSINLNQETYAERARLRILLAYYYEEDADNTAAMVDAMAATDEAARLPGEILSWLGEQFAARGNHQQAVKYLLQLTAGGNPMPIPVSSWLLLADCQTQLKNWDASLAAAGRAIEESKSPSEQADGYLAIARAHLGSGNTQQARVAVADAMSLQPEGTRNAEARMIEAEIEFSESRYSEAAKAFQRVAVLYDDEMMAPRALKRAYDALIKSGNTVEAGQILNEIRTRFPEYPLEASN